jgi:hypothetical protein
VKESNPAELRAIQLLIDSNPKTLETANKGGMTSIMCAISSCNESWFGSDEPIPDSFLQFLLEMVRRAPKSARVLSSRHSNGIAQSTALELACKKLPNLELVSALIEACPIALCVAPKAELVDLPPQVAGKVEFEADAMFLALAEVVLHDITIGVIDDRIRDHAAQLVRKFVPIDSWDAGSYGIIQAVNARVLGEDRQRLRSRVLGFDPLQEYLRATQPMQELITGVYRMNKAGRQPGKREAAGSEAPSTETDLERHIRVLEAAGDNLSCAFIHLRDSPILFSRIPFRAGVTHRPKEPEDGDDEKPEPAENTALRRRSVGVSDSFSRVTWDLGMMRRGCGPR